MRRGGGSGRVRKERSSDEGRGERGTKGRDDGSRIRGGVAAGAAGVTHNSNASPKVSSLVASSSARTLVLCFCLLSLDSRSSTAAAERGGGRGEGGGSSSGRGGETKRAIGGGDGTGGAVGLERGRGDVPLTHACLGSLSLGGTMALTTARGAWGWEAARGRGCCAVRWPPRGTRRARLARRGLRGEGVSRRAVRGDLVGAARREDGAARTRDGHCAGGHGSGLEIARRRTGARDAPPPNAAPRTSEPRRASTVCRWRLGWRELLTASSRQAAVLVVSTALTRLFVS